MNPGWEKIKRAWNENPVQVLVVAGFVATAVTKLMKANTERQNASTYRREVDRRIAMKGR